MKPYIFAFLILVSGCSTYSEIDGSIWDSFDRTYKKWVVTFKLPAGQQERTPHTTEEYLGVASFHYDVLSGTGRYGVLSGETEIDMFVVFAKEKQQYLHVEYRMQTDLVDCIKGKYLSWDKITCENSDSGYVVLFHLKQLYPGEILYIATRISRAAYKKKKVREQRLKMFRDILDTVSVENATGVMNTNN